MAGRSGPVTGSRLRRGRGERGLRGSTAADAHADPVWAMEGAAVANGEGWTVLLDRPLPSTPCIRGRRIQRTFRETTTPGPETHAETSKVDAPPDRARRHGDRVPIGHAGTKDGAGCPQNDPAEQAGNGDPVEPASAGVRGGLALVQVGGPLPLPMDCGDRRRGGAAQVCRARCLGHNILLPRHSGVRCPIGLSKPGPSRDEAEFVIGRGFRGL
jgi:hypothetical protein